MWYWGVVIVSIREYKEDSKSFWNVSILVSYENTDIQILTTWDNLQDVTYFFVSLWLSPYSVNFIDNPIPDWEAKAIIDSALSKIQEENEKVKKEKEEKEEREKKKYSEDAIEDSLKIVNFEIDHIEQILKAWSWILSWVDIKKLEDLCNELKRIRLWTNFNKMATLILYSHKLTKKAEEDILSGDNWKSFLIDKNSIVTNIDFISELSDLNRISGKNVVKPNLLTTDESIRNMLWLNSVFFRMFIKDFFNSCKQSSISEVFRITMELIEYIILIVIVIFSFLWLIDPLLWVNRFSLYLLPAAWWLGLLIYLFNSLKLEWAISRIVGFAVLIIVYWYWLILLKGSFAL